MSQGIPSIEALESVHSFPGSYTIKAIGDNDPAFVERVHNCIKDCLDSNEFLQDSKERVSSKGNHISVTAVLHVQTANKVRILYQELLKVEQLRMLL